MKKNTYLPFAVETFDRACVISATAKIDPCLKYRSIPVVMGNILGNTETNTKVYNKKTMSVDSTMKTIHPTDFHYP